VLGKFIHDTSREHDDRRSAKDFAQPARAKSFATESIQRGQEGAT
jgi:hypothetical protein